MIRSKRRSEISSKPREKFIQEDRKMKHLFSSVLTILFMTSAALAASETKADVYIYSFTEKSTEYTCDMNFVWHKSIVTNRGYIVMQIFEGISPMYAWIVTTYKAPDANDKMQKYARSSSYLVYSIAYADFGTKQSWIINLSSPDQHKLISGDNKPVWIRAFGYHISIPKTFKGADCWYYTTSEDNTLHTGTSTTMLRYHSKFTNYYFSDPDPLTGQDAVTDIIFPYLIDKGYKIVL